MQVLHGQSHTVHPVEDFKLAGSRIQVCDGRVCFGVADVLP